MEATSRDRSPLRHPDAANIGLTPSFDHHILHSDLFQAPNNSSYNEAAYTATLDQSQYFEDHSFNPYSQSARQQQSAFGDDLASLNYDPTITDHFPQALSNHTSPAPIQESISFSRFEFNPDSLDNTLINDLDLLQQPGVNYTSSNGMDSMSTAMNTHSPTPPHLLPNMGRNSTSPSPRATPNKQQSPFMGRARNTSESLDPASANYLPQNGEWAHVPGYRGHRRMHSDNLSDMSSHSAHASPYLATLDSFDTANQASPLLSAQDPIFGDALGIGQFSLSDSVGPAHSPHLSPGLPAQQQPLPHFTAADGFGLNTPQYGQTNGFDAFPDIQEVFPTFNGTIPCDMGQLDHMSPPEINIDYAPPTRPVETSRPSLTDDSLVPPTRVNRTRAKSDSYAGPRPMTPSAGSRARSPSQPGNALSPFNVPSNPSSREPSPARGRNGSISRGRSTSATSDQRDYIIGLAEPQRSSSTDKRQQKHPATFQCHLCPKRFTRAYNLRSHLRTHTDERPFICTVCDKAFARQHDRKRHEGLHSGEKKFVCRGPLKNGTQWGCSRRFARADALGRHFRSEAGRVCIRPLLEEEAVEQQQAIWQEQAVQGAYTPSLAPAAPLPFFPRAILQQFPDLAGMDWNQPQSIGDEEYAGRSSFDASSGGEMYDEVSENEMRIPAYGLQPQMNAYNNHQMGDFTNGFEGR